jgi:hypothetical protein
MPPADFPLLRDELFMSITAHEIAHQLIDARNRGVFNGNEHTTHATNPRGTGDAFENAKSLLAEPASSVNCTLSTVTIFPGVQQELRLRTAPALS